MTLTPSSVRLDLKCGKGAISKGEKCHKGPTSQAQAERQLINKGRIPRGWVARRQTWGERFRDNMKNNTGLVITNTAKTGALMGAIIGGVSGGLPGAALGAAGGATFGGALGAASSPLGAAMEASLSYPTAVLERKKSKRRDSIWAVGFEP